MSKIDLNLFDFVKTKFHYKYFKNGNVGEN